MEDTQSSAQTSSIINVIIVALLISIVCLVSMPVAAQDSDVDEVQIKVVDGDVATGEEVTIQATIAGTPVSGGEVIVSSDKEPVELTTNANGEATFKIPDSDFVEVTVVSESEGVSGEKSLIGEDPPDDDTGENATTIDINIIKGTVATGNTITIEATDDDDPVQGATVFVENDTTVFERTTTENGQVTFVIPSGEYVSVTVEARDSKGFGRRTLIGESAEKPPDNPPAEEGPGVAGDIRIDVVNNRLSRGEKATIRATLDGEPVVNAPVMVRGGSGNTEIKTQTNQTGQASFTIPDTEVVVVSVEPTNKDVFGEKQLFGEPDGGPDGESNFNISVINTSITHVGGPRPDKDPTVDAFVSGNMLQVQLKTGAETGLSGYDLSDIGVTTDSEFTITVTTTSFDPRLMIGTGNDVSWDYSVTDDTTTIVITTKPASKQLIQPTDGNAPRLGNWPEGSDDTATTSRRAAADFAIDSLSGSGQEALQGGYIATDAQAFSTPVYFPPRPAQSPELQVDVAGPHRTVNGTENDGFYRAKLPDSLLSDWGISDPSDLTAAYKGSEKTFSTTNVSDGILIGLDIGYSSGTVLIGTKPAESAPANDTGENVSGGAADSNELTTFTNTSRPGNITPSSLDGTVRTESAVADEVEIELLRDTPTNYSLAITAPNGTTDVTFYVQSQAIESSQGIDNVTMYLDGTRQNFSVAENAGPGQSPWIGFEVSEFSTRTVSFIADSSSNTETTQEVLSVTSESSAVAPGENVTLTYTVSNTQDQSAAYTLTADTVSANLSVVSITGDLESSDLGGDELTATTTNLRPGGSGSINITYQAASDAAGEATINVSAEDPLSATSGSAATEVTFRNQTATDPTKRALKIAGKPSSAELTQNDVTAAVTRFNRGQSVDGVRVTQDDVTALITLFERS